MKSLTAYRRMAKMSQKQLAQKIGMSQEIISQYETGTRKPDILIARKIAKYFNVGLDEIYFGVEEI